MKTEYYLSRLNAGLSGFDGFVNRWTLPRSHVEKDDVNMTSLLLIVDTALEMKVGMAPHFPYKTLAKNEVMLQQTLMDFLHVTVNDTVNLVFNTSAIAANKMVQSYFGVKASPIPERLVLPFKVVASYEKAEGLFPAPYGIVSLLDCHYLADSVIDAAEEENKKNPDIMQRAQIKLELEYVRLMLANTNTTFCTYTIELDGVLSDQAQYYLGTQDQNRKGVIEQS
jgi:hypothetical protein